MVGTESVASTTQTGPAGAEPHALSTGPIDPNYELSPAPTEAEQPSHLPQADPGRRSHAARPPLAALVLLLLVAAGVWWLYANDWTLPETLPWEKPEGPLAASGTLESDEIMVAFEVPGRIVELVQEGQTVQAGEAIAKLDDALIRLQIHQAGGAQLQQLQLQADRYLLQSPISGVVTRMPMHRGEYVMPGQTVAAVADLTSLEMTAYVLERDLGAVQVGQPVTITADPFPDRTFSGVVISTNPRAEFTPRNVQTQADRLNLVFGVKIRVDNPDSALKPGMPADVLFPAAPE